MTHLTTTLPAKVEIGAQRRLDYGTEIVTTDSGGEVRNNRWEEPLRTYDVSFPIADRADATFLAVLALYTEARGNLHSFDFNDWVDGITVPVRFDGPLASVGVTPELEHIIEVTLVEVRLFPLTYVGGKAATRTGAGTWVIPLTDLVGGTDYAPGPYDTVVVAYSNAGAADRNLAASGYTEIADLYANDTADANLGVFRKTMGALPDSQVSLTAFAEENAAVVHVWRNADLVTPMDVAAVTFSGTDGGVPNPPTITPVTEGAVILAIGHAAAPTGVGAELTHADLDNLQSTLLDGVTYGNMIAMGSVEWPGDGAYNPAAFGGGTSNTGASRASVTLALRPQS